MINLLLVGHGGGSNGGEHGKIEPTWEKKEKFVFSMSTKRINQTVPNFKIWNRLNLSSHSIVLYSLYN